MVLFLRSNTHAAKSRWPELLSPANAADFFNQKTVLEQAA
jgi:hypothetical protein